MEDNVLDSIISSLIESYYNVVCFNTNNIEYKDRVDLDDEMIDELDELEELDELDYYIDHQKQYVD